ncbi:hypothetical protein [Pimelobacter sp. 30-1]|uniref:hypothetical protein n=1 Tax=Pimelobacter sp. 30-1 TaxID=2004991 RepID=UPI001C043703|nr:hypothetical protein [Pimelobacter sp. 30-1]MBU2698330.1 hypothetical protein [Pimelobacter sp. 30-1]
MSNTGWGSSLWEQAQKVRVTKGKIEAPVRADGTHGIQVGDFSVTGSPIPATGTTPGRRAGGRPRVVACFLLSTALNLAALRFMVDRDDFLDEGTPWLPLTLAPLALSVLVAALVRRRWGRPAARAVRWGALAPFALLVLVFAVFAMSMTS